MINNLENGAEGGQQTQTKHNHQSPNLVSLVHEHLHTERLYLQVCLIQNTKNIDRYKRRKNSKPPDMKSSPQSESTTITGD